MQQRRPVVGNGRPSGTDGFDFSYRMTVDSRYTKVAQGKTRLAAFFVTQAVILLVGLPSLLLSLQNEVSPDKLVVAPAVIGFFSLLIGESGRRRSKAIFLKIYMLASSLALLTSTAVVVRSNFFIEVLNDPSRWETNKLEVIKIASLVLGLVIQMFTVGTTISLIRNMSPPKRAS